MIPYDLLRKEAAGHPYPLLFATISGAHLYGFPSPDSDYDLRGVHVLPLNEVLGLLPQRDTFSLESFRGDIELDLVTHDVLKFFSMLLKRNGYVLEQLHSPLIVHSTAEFEEVRAIAQGCVTRHHSHHYLGFAATQWGLFEKEDPPRVKPLLYVFRVLLTGIHLMRTGEVEANILNLNQSMRLPYIDELVGRKVSGKEKSTLERPEFGFYRSEYHRLVGLLESEAKASTLPVEATCLEALNRILVQIRLKLRR